MEKQYIPRIADKLLSRKLEGKGAVLIEGAKWCGKTTTAEQQARSILFMTEPGKTQQNIQLAELNPSLLLRGDKPRLIDEWQVAPKIWDAVRFEADHAGEYGLFILTGSSVPPDMSDVLHTGTGRFAWLRMRPMSLWESGDSSGEVSLGKMFSEDYEIAGIGNIDIQRLAFLVCRGGWPSTLRMREEIALDQAFDYISAVENYDLNKIDGKMRNPEMIHRLLQSYARHQGTQANNSVIRDDLIIHEGDSFTEATIGEYLRSLKRIFIIEDAPAWNPNLRSKTAIRTSETHYFTDPSIATAALGLGPNDLIADLETFGLILETLCIRDLRIYAESINGKVYHYRDKTGLECDAVVHLRDGRYGLIEIKLGGDKAIESGAQTLKNLAAKIDTGKMPSPSFLMVITGVGQYAYRRQDGVCVVPIGTLKN